MNCLIRPLGVTGGWAGGEVGFQKFVEEIEPSVPQKKEKKEKRNGPKKAGKGKDKIYVGFDYKFRFKLSKYGNLF